MKSLLYHLNTIFDRYQNQAAYIREFEESAQARKESFQNRGARRLKGSQRYQGGQKMDTSEDLQMVGIIILWKMGLLY